MLKKLTALSLVEWLVIAAIIAILAALFVPGSQWASSGDVEVPVQVTVFDATTGKRIPGARVAIMRGLPAAMSNDFSTRFPDRVVSSWRDLNSRESGETTDALGTALILQRFTTGASHTRPEAHAHVNNCWVLISTDLHGSIAVPLRHESMPIKMLREMEALPVAIGLSPSSASLTR